MVNGATFKHYQPAVYPGLVPLIMLCNASPSTRAHLPVLFPSDLIFCSLLATLAFTNGYVGNICLIQAPKRVSAPKDREAISILTNSATVLGIASGSFVGCLLQRTL